MIAAKESLVVLPRGFRMMLAALAATQLVVASCGPAQEPGALPTGLVLALARFASGPDGPVPQPARVGMLTRHGEKWRWRFLDDPDSNVFHKAMAWEYAPGNTALLTAGGTRALLKLWLPEGGQRVVWEAEFGGKFSRMRDVEVADLYGSGEADLVVATHDQGVVAVVRPGGPGAFRVTELDRDPGTIVHEVEVGDLDGDGTLEVYATPSRPNRLDGSAQPGQIVRYVPVREEGRAVIADLGDRHAKEILVDDVDGDGRDELYAAVEAVSGGQVEIRRWDDGDEGEGMLIAALPDTLCRFLTPGDVDGDGVQEMVAATHKGGLWLLRPAEGAGESWRRELVDRESSGFEHAALLTDLDGDGTDELYVADDGNSQVARYVWRASRPEKTVIYTHPDGLDGFTWNLMPAPVAALPPP